MCSEMSWLLIGNKNFMKNVYNKNKDYSFLIGNYLTRFILINSVIKIIYVQYFLLNCMIHLILVISCEVSLLL